eukprot:TRINITY_DN7862_c0_g1_i1.p1 TRINITY_DN7862_c0_g1~~TRINITY_DN7862_c0_g1_i1.p1  ORF type:complete len:603 (-),score=72.83 TRINITY_DN7862_c0_g1_i1:85-1623(-)
MWKKISRPLNEGLGLPTLLEMGDRAEAADALKMEAYDNIDQPLKLTPLSFTSLIAGPNAFNEWRGIYDVSDPEVEVFLSGVLDARSQVDAMKALSTSQRAYSAAVTNYIPEASDIAAYYDSRLVAMPGDRRPEEIETPPAPEQPDPTTEGVVGGIAARLLKSRKRRGNGSPSPRKEKVRRTRASAVAPEPSSAPAPAPALVPTAEPIAPEVVPAEEERSLRNLPVIFQSQAGASTLSAELYRKHQAAVRDQYRIQSYDPTRRLPPPIALTPRVTMSPSPRVQEPRQRQPSPQPQPTPVIAPTGGNLPQLRTPIQPPHFEQVQTPQTASRLPAPSSQSQSQVASQSQQPLTQEPTDASSLLMSPPPSQSSNFPSQVPTAAVSPAPVLSPTIPTTPTTAAIAASPPRPSSAAGKRKRSTGVSNTPTPRKRVKFTPEEDTHIVAGYMRYKDDVNTLHMWKTIRNAPNLKDYFHPTRTPNDLSNRLRNLRKFMTTRERSVYARRVMSAATTLHEKL